MSIRAGQHGRPQLHGLREENRTLYGVIKLVSSSLELGPMLQGIVDLATEATDCHACFIYLLEGDRLTIRAASPVFADAVGKRADRGRGGADRLGRAPPHARVHPRARDGRPADEVRAAAAGGALPVDGRGADPVARGRHDRRDRAAHRGAARVHRGHAQAARPHRLAGQRRDRERPALRPGAPARRRADAPVRRSAPGGRRRDRRGASSGSSSRRARARLLERRGLPALPARRRRRRAAAARPPIPEAVSAPPALSAAGLLLDGARRPRRPARRRARCGPSSTSPTCWSRRCRPAASGSGCCAPGRAPGARSASEDAELARAIAHLAAVAIKRAELIEGLTKREHRQGPVRGARGRRDRRSRRRRRPRSAAT